MRIKPCPQCGRKPKIKEGISRKGYRFYSIGCPNYHFVLRLNQNDRWSLYNRKKRARLYFNENIDYNTMYKHWNEELIDE